MLLALTLQRTCRAISGQTAPGLPARLVFPPSLVQSLFCFTGKPDLSPFDACLPFPALSSQPGGRGLITAAPLCPTAVFADGARSPCLAHSIPSCVPQDTLLSCLERRQLCLRGCHCWQAGGSRLRQLPRGTGATELLLQEHSWAGSMADSMPEIMSCAPGDVAQSGSFQAVWVLGSAAGTSVLRGHQSCLCTQQGASGHSEHFSHFPKLSDVCAVCRGHTGWAASRETGRGLLWHLGEFRSLWDLFSCWKMSLDLLGPCHGREEDESLV